jgi:HD-GYP domain-containing protein (c-di-GMP phosphodiesterase class II)
MITDQAASAFGTQELLIPPAEAMLEQEVNRLTDALVARFEELTLIHELSQNLTLMDPPTAVVRLLLDELLPCLEAETLLISLLADGNSDLEAILETAGEPIDPTAAHLLADTVMQRTQHRVGSTAVAIANSLAWQSRTIHVVVVSIQHESTCLGRMIAIRSENGKEFGTIEAELMKSTSLMLGVHLINQRQYSELQHMFEGMIQSLVSALDAKDTYTHGHSNRVAELSVILARRLGYQEEQLANILMGGILHDIGKIGVDEAVLRKPGKLTDEEFEQIKQHPTIGFDILKGIRKLAPILPIVRNHHESWDGRGYPDELAGEDIPRDAQIVAVADAFDAMTSDRPYRRGMSLEKVTEIFKQGRGTQWAPDVVDALLSLPEVMEQYARRELPAS